LVGVRCVQEEAECPVVGCEGTLYEAVSGEEDETDPVARQAADEVPNLILCPLEAARGHVLGPHRRRDVQGNHQVYAATLHGTDLRPKAGTHQAHRSQKQRPHHEARLHGPAARANRCRKLLHDVYPPEALLGRSSPTGRPPVQPHGGGEDSQRPGVRWIQPIHRRILVSELRIVRCERRPRRSRPSHSRFAFRNPSLFQGKRRKTVVAKPMSSSTARRAGSKK